MIPTTPSGVDRWSDGTEHVTDGDSDYTHSRVGDDGRHWTHSAHCCFNRLSTSSLRGAIIYYRYSETLSCPLQAALITITITMRYLYSATNKIGQYREDDNIDIPKTLSFIFNTQER